MKNKLISSAPVALPLIFLLLISCKKTGDQNLPSDPVAINITAEQSSLIRSENSFAFDIFREVLSSAEESGNVVISPLSISTALSMTLNGANGDTQNGMLDALRLTGLTPESINSSYRDLSAALLSVDKRVLIKIANSVWTEKNLQVKIPFRDILTGYYNAEAREFNASDAGASKEVNSWIEDNTNGLIKEMLDRIPHNTVMMLINAIYFKGKWKLQFDEARTITESFYKADGTTAEVPMMKQEKEFKIYQGVGYTLAEFPYGQGNYVMDVLIPDSDKGLSSLVPLLTADIFTNSVEQLSGRQTILSFPRFKYGYKVKLNNILSDMGMGLAFTDTADFRNIADEGLRIDLVLHQAFIETNEEGTEAAAATVVGIVNSSSPPPAFTLRLDHPFIYIIRETSTNSILFMGKIADPLAG